MLNCPSCRSDNPDGARFCNNCGSPLDTVREVEGERKLVTVLFADVVGSTAMAERLDAEDWAAVMNGAFAFMNNAVERYDGTVARLMGDAILALFGAPRTHEDDAERAVRAGLEIRDGAVAYATMLRADYGIDFGVRIGINTGEVVLSVLGNQIKSEYTAMGDTANVAARLQSVARAGAVLISTDTWRLVRHTFEMEPRGLTEVKGKTAPIETFEVVAALAAPEDARGLEGLRSPLVGRDRELGALRQRVNSLRESGGAVLAIVGEAGLGKSRLVAELRDGARSLAIPPHWLECRGVSYGQSIAYHPWKQLGLGLIGASVADGAAEVREKLHAFGRRVGVLDVDVPFLETMMSVDSETSRAALRDHGDDDLTQPMSEAVIRTIMASIHADAEPSPLVLVFDDLHWADAASVELLAAVVSLARTEPLLLVCVLRPDRSAPSWSLLQSLRDRMGDHFAEMQLEPLDRDRARELLGNLLRVEDMPDTVRGAILERSEGNPFFIEEVLRSLMDSGHLVRENGHWRATAEIATVRIPDTLAGVLAARIDRLPDQTKRVAQAAAVLGRIFQQRALSSVCGRAPDPDRVDNVEPHLGTLRYEELVRELATVPEREFIFKHALTQETAYNLLLRRRRRELHRLAGEVLEEMLADRLDEAAPILAWHFEQAGDAERTAQYAMRGAQSSTLLFAVKERQALYERAYDALQRMEQPPAELLVDAVLEWTVTSYKLRRYDGVIDRLLEAERVVRAVDDRSRLAKVLSWLSLIYMVTGFPSRAEPYLVEGDRLARELGEEKLMLLPFFFATDSMIDLDPRGAAERMQEVIALARRHRMPEVEGHALASSAIAYARLGEFERADEFIERALAAAPSGGHRVKEADVHLLVGNAYLEMDRLDEALRHLQQGTAMAQAENALECVCVGAYSMGVGELGRDQIAEARRQFDMSLGTGERAGWGGWSGFINRVRAGLAMAQLELGDPRALEDLEQALANANRDHDEYQAAQVAERLATVQLERGDTARAASLLDSALDYYTRTGMVRYEARARAAREQVRERAGSATSPGIEA